MNCLTKKLYTEKYNLNRMKQLTLIYFFMSKIIWFICLIFLMVSYIQIWTQSYIFNINEYFIEKQKEFKLNNRLSYLNQERYLNWKHQLKLNDKLQKTAEEYSKRMNDSWIFEHIDSDWNRVWERILNNWYDYHIALENLWRWFQNFESLIEAFKNSESHKKNLFDERVYEVWIWEYNWYWTLILWKEYETKKNENLIILN